MTLPEINFFARGWFAVLRHSGHTLFAYNPPQRLAIPVIIKNGYAQHDNNDNQTPHQA
jgi:hypothetical protein